MKFSDAVTPGGCRLPGALFITCTVAASAMAAGSTIFVLCAVLASSVVSVPIHDFIKNMPGWDRPLPSKMFSGFIDAGVDCPDGTCYTMHEHYMFIESEGDPATDPLVLWTNGGPGAASLYGLFVELGPFSLSDRSLMTDEYNRTGVPTLFRNNYTWSKFSNLLIINSPPPVGFSYCDPIGPAGNGLSCGSWNDTRTAYHNLIFLKNWYNAFPKFRQNDLYLTGESYAGIYVPTLARAILADNSQSDLPIPLAGWAVGDACMGTDLLCGNEGPYFYIEFMHGHGQFSDKTYEDIHDKCKRHELVKNVPTSTACRHALKKMQKEIGGYYDYSLYDECWYENDFAWISRLDTHWSSTLSPAVAAASSSTSAARPGHLSPRPPLAERSKGYSCGGSGALTQWVNSPAVRSAIHVPQDAVFFSVDNGADFVYNLTERDLVSFYRHVARGTPLRVLVYNGDSDPSINSFSAENWTRYMGLKETESWRPWTMDGQQFMGGYVTRYEGDFDFLTIRGAGHMVPLYKPAAAHAMLSFWLKGQDWPTYTPPPQPPGARGTRARGGHSVPLGRWEGDAVVA